MCRQAVVSAHSIVAERHVAWLDESLRVLWLHAICRNCVTVCRVQQAAAGHMGWALVERRVGQAVHRRRGGAMLMTL